MLKYLLITLKINFILTKNITKNNWHKKDTRL